MHRHLVLNRTAAAMAALGVMTLTACATTADKGTSPPAPTVRSDDPGLGMTPGAPAPMPDMPGMSSTPRTPAVAAGPNAVTIDNFAFGPQTVSVKAGTTVTWTNRDEEPHTVVARDGSFHSPGMGTGATFSFTFAQPGTFAYFCSIHPFMHATVVVTP
ncbi:plastocyanin [Nocardia kruczakiae]|uniref:Plastocyanin n=2 Tax=Nocardia kruczakiae TaxID=261477 RepID=A0ABU1XDP3_9NOCA|nr:cupredoxin family copper-binding protein [Nocardia kruczakiae]MDR7168609.1 plastocyanin [Nocardia kruczakiae]